MQKKTRQNYMKNRQDISGETFCEYFLCNRINDKDFRCKTEKNKNNQDEFKNLFTEIFTFFWSVFLFI